MKYDEDLSAKPLTPEELTLWDQVFIASVKAGSPGNAKQIAATAVIERRLITESGLR